MQSVGLPAGGGAWWAPLWWPVASARCRGQGARFRVWVYNLYESGV